MSFAVIHTRALVGAQAVKVRVEVHLGAGLPCFNLVGLADTEVRESRERVRSALINSGFEFPNQRITVNLAPADLPKGSGRFDLPVALGIAAASGQLPNADLSCWEFAGELSLSGELLPCHGSLALALAQAREAERSQLMLPACIAEEASFAPHIAVYGAPCLLAAAAHLVGHGEGLKQVQRPHHPPSSTLADMRDVRGQAMAKRAMEIAAAGLHNVLMQGPPGSGKSMLAMRLPSILPRLSEQDALEAAALASLKGNWSGELGIRPFRAPHHSSSMAALIGGGRPPKPGEATLAHHGVLFLDEVLEFDRRCLEALREPLETGQVNVSRVGYQSHFPARFQWVVAHNPCPCGWHGQAMKTCRCTEEQIQRYRQRLSGPLLDRIDLGLIVKTMDQKQLISAADGESSSAIQERTQAAYARQLHRQGCANRDLSGDRLLAICPLDSKSETLLLDVSKQRDWSARSIHRVIKLARTIADLAAQDAIRYEHVAEAIQFRKF